MIFNHFLWSIKANFYYFCRCYGKCVLSNQQQKLILEVILSRGGQAKIFLALFPSWKPDSLARRLQRERIRTANPRPWPLLVPHPAFWLANGNVFVRELILSSRNFAEILAKFCQKFGNAKNSPNFCRNFRESLPKFWRKVFAEVLPKIWRNLCQIFAEV